MKPWFDVANVERLGKYDLVRHLASGGMARIYLARVLGVGGFERHVVLKTVRPERIEDESYLTMFLDEARLLATLHHQHVAQVYEVGVADDGTYFLAMEYLHGETVRAVLARARQGHKRLPFDFALTVVANAASGLHHAHERRGNDGQPLGIVHRDVSPSNIICGYDGSVKLIDFGIAKADARSTVTQTGFVKGKAGYMAPEQALGYPVDRRSDVFALGVVMYELCTQHRAFRAASEHESVQRMVRGDVTKPSKLIEGFPRDLEDVILHALELDPDDRYRTCEDMRQAIERVAAQVGAPIGPGGISRALDTLFGARPEPWLAGAPLADEGEASQTTESAVLVALSGPASQPPMPAPAPVAVAAPAPIAVPHPAPSQWTEGTRPPAPRAKTATLPPRPRSSTMPPVAAPPPALPPIPRARTSTMPPVNPPFTVSEDPKGPSRTAPAQPEDLPTSRFTPVEDLRMPGLAPAYSAAPAPAPERTRAPTTPLRISMSMAAPASAPIVVPAASPPLAPLPLPPAPAPTPARAIAIGTAPPPFVANEPVAIVLRSSRRRVLAIALPCAAILGAVLALFVVPGGGDDDARSAPAAASALPSSAPLAPSAETIAPHANAPAPRAQPAAPAPAPATITLHVTTDPSDGTVLLDDMRLGHAPYTGAFAAQPGKTGWLKVRKHGYVAVKRLVALDQDITWDVHLHHATSAPAAAAAPTP